MFSILKKIKIYENKSSIKKIFFTLNISGMHKIKNIYLKDVTRAILYYKEKEKIELMREISEIILDLKIEENTGCEVSETIYEVFYKTHDDIKKINQGKEKGKEILIEYYSKDERKKNNKEKLNKIISL